MSLRPPTPLSTSLSTSTLSWMTGPSAPSRNLQGPSGGSLWSGRIFHRGLPLLFITHDPAVRGSAGSLRLRRGKGGGAALGDSVPTGAPQSPHPQPSVGHPDPDCPQPGRHPRPRIPAWLPDPSPPPPHPLQVGREAEAAAGPGGTIAPPALKASKLPGALKPAISRALRCPDNYVERNQPCFPFSSQRKK